MASFSREPVLPSWKAFVVQLSRDPDPELTRFSGRVEHVSTGRSTHFDTKAELLAFVRSMLARPEPSLKKVKGGRERGAKV
jgi:hypothetical protein